MPIPLKEIGMIVKRTIIGLITKIKKIGTSIPVDNDTKYTIIPDRNWKIIDNKNAILSLFLHDAILENETQILSKIIFIFLGRILLIKLRKKVKWDEKIYIKINTRKPENKLKTIFSTKVLWNIEKLNA